MYKIVARDIVITLLMISILCACYFPIMPQRMDMVIHTALVLIFAVVSFLLWFDRPQDEREQAHKLFATKMAFTVGGVILVVGIVDRSLSGELIDPYLAYAFAGMIIARAVGRVWAHYCR